MNWWPLTVSGTVCLDKQGALNQKETQLNILRYIMHFDI